ncbi:hypothetical protein LA76x_3480 [Lysobacter antibioticus]|uniref:Uncharacterized protein n=1 Tax=Lysobacter antibioticus TaxID=84531 RepID=A0A0S2FDM1_LYSAN|nr:hypothetical protein LA76x_3480 [Lysobacter antibioticus]
MRVLRGVPRIRRGLNDWRLLKHDAVIGQGWHGVTEPRV